MPGCMVGFAGPAGLSEDEEHCPRKGVMALRHPEATLCPRHYLMLEGLVRDQLGTTTQIAEAILLDPENSYMTPEEAAAQEEWNR